MCYFRTAHCELYCSEIEMSMNFCLILAPLFYFQNGNDIIKKISEEVFRMSVSSRIVALRERCGLNQKELAENLHMNRSVLNRIESGTRPVRDDELKIFADYFNVSADYLLGRDATKAPSLSEEQRNLLSGFDNLNSAGRNLLVGVLNSLRVSHAAIA